MTSGRSRLKAIEKHGVGKRWGRQRGTGIGSLRAPFLPSTQPADHPNRPKTSSECKQFMKTNEILWNVQHF